jgi:glycosyltransferase involved in cell wall biosynthesis
VFQRLHFVVPAHNEAACIGRVIRLIRELYPDACVVVVNDGSDDNTGYVAREAGATIIEMPFNSGYGVAVHTGLRWAYAQSADAVVTLDADGQHDPAEVGQLLKVLRESTADVVIGSRYRQHGARYRVPVARRVVSWLLALGTSLLTRESITDPTSGFQALGPKAIALYARMRDFPESTPDADLIVYAVRQGLRVREAAVLMYADQGSGSMHAGLKAVLYCPKMLFALVGVMATAPKRPQ